MKRTAKSGMEDIRLKFQGEPTKAICLIQDGLYMTGIRNEIAITSKAQALELMEALQSWVEAYGDQLD